MTTALKSLFPTAVLHEQTLIDGDRVASCLACIAPAAQAPNSQDSRLSHTAISKPEDLDAFSAIREVVMPQVRSFGMHLFGEELDWMITGVWVNRLQTGGQQAMHVHANSFISGVVYLTDSHPSANLMFQRPSANGSFVFSNFNPDSSVTPYNADRWQMPAIGTGDLVLFPSHLMHGVPENRGGERISLSFNAVPDRLNSWGYEIRFAAP